MMIDDRELELELEEAPEPDPLEGASPFYRALVRAQAAAQRPARSLEEEQPELMAAFVTGPYIDNGDGTFDCIFRHPVLGDLPFTASADDVEPHGRAAHAYIASQLKK